MGQLTIVTKQDELVLSDDYGAVSTARRFVADRLSEWGRSDVVEDAQLCTSELVTNALLHSHTEATLLVRVDDAAVRVEVHDGSRHLPARGPMVDDAMTGRGLLLVESLATAWGVEPDAAGKSVWFELSADAAEAVARSEQELLSAWDVEESLWEEPVAAGPPVFEIGLGDVPIRLVLDAAAHVDNLVREFVLATPGTSTGPPDALAERVERLVSGFDPHVAVRTLAQQAAERGETRVSLDLELPLSAAASGGEFVEVLSDADEYCRAARLLTLESPPQFRLFREWYVERLTALLEAAAAGRPVARQTFEDRLVRELETTAITQRALQRSARLQQLTAALASALTGERVAAAVLEEGVRTLGASAAGVLVPGPGEGLVVIGSVGYDEALIRRLATERVDALPVGVALASGEPVWVESPEERDARFPGLAEVDRASAALCVIPLEVDGHVLGVLRFSFAERGLFGEQERAFLLALGAQAAQALDRARIYAREKEARHAAEAAAARLARLHMVALRWSRTSPPTVGEPDAQVERRAAPRVAPPVEWASLAYQAVLDGLSDAVVVADASGTIRYVNRSTESLLGAGAGELSSLPLTELVPLRLRAAHTAGLARYVATREPVLIGTAVQVPALRRDGTEVPVELTLSVVPVTPGSTDVEGDLLFVASLRDLSDRRSSV